MLTQVVRKAIYGLLGTSAGETLFFKMGRRLFALPYISKHNALSQRYLQSALQGSLNYKVIPGALNRIWPFWVYQQFNAKGHFSAQGFPLGVTNHTHRNWTCLSVPKSDYFLTVDPRGLITPFSGGWSIDFWISTSNGLFSPAKADQVTQRFDNNPPCVITTVVMNQVQIESTVFMMPRADEPALAFATYTVTNLSEEPQPVGFYVAIRPYNPEGIAPIDDITYMSSNAFVVNAQLALLMDRKPQNVVCLTYDDGDISEHHEDWEMILKATCKSHLASGFAKFEYELEPKASETVNVTLNCHPTKHIKRAYQAQLSRHQQEQLSQRIKKVQLIKPESQLDRLNKTWTKIREPLATVSVPDDAIQSAFTYAQTHLLSLIGTRNPFSPGLSNRPLIMREMASAILALNRIGAVSYSKSLLAKISHTHSDRQYDQLGQYLFAMQDFYHFVRDKDFLTQSAKLIDRYAKKIHRQTAKKQANADVVGLIGPSLSLDEWGEADFWMWDNFWSIAGLRAAAQMALVLEKREKAAQYKQLESQLNTRVLMYLNQLAEKYEYPFIPCSEKSHIDSRMVTGLAAVFPLHIFDAQNSRVTNSLKLIESKYLVDGVLFKQGGESGYDIPLNCLLAQAYLSRKDAKGYALLKWITQHASATGAFPQSIHPNTLGGSSGDGHSVWAAAEYIQLVRHILIADHKKVLHLLPGVPEDWLSQDNAVIQASQLPTRFGTIDFTFKKVDGAIELDLECTYKKPPSSIVVEFPFELKSITIDGHTKSTTQSKVQLPINTKTAVFHF